MTPDISEIVKLADALQAEMNDQPLTPMRLVDASRLQEAINTLRQCSERTRDAERKAAQLLIAANIWQDRAEAAVKALKSASTQCDNVIYNCNQRPADNQRHLDSWCSVKAYIDTAIRNDAVVSSPVGGGDAS